MFHHNWFHMDIGLTGPLSESSAVHKYVHISVYCTKWVAAFALESKYAASGVAKVVSNTDYCLTICCKKVINCKCSRKWAGYLELCLLTRSQNPTTR